MKVLYSFIGNICSGKSTVSEIVSKELNINHYSVDKYRVKHNAYLITEEWSAWDELTNAISKQNTALLESSGLSQNLTDIYKLFDKVVIILFECPKEILIERIVRRNNSNYSKIPFCYKTDQPIEVIVSNFETKLEKITPDFTFNSHYLTVKEITNQIIQIFNANE